MFLALNELQQQQLDNNTSLKCNKKEIIKNINFDP